MVRPARAIRVAETHRTASADWNAASAAPPLAARFVRAWKSRDASLERRPRHDRRAKIGG
ncbi:hypothetical protein WS70_24865 [Burkholderia mayonis]|uniref:Uncharacterized protein n=1 Tax=Burkholderia mayonis TaxID=1385591 RepID=A0A1B4FMS3_9BURK|nr:hypothetical protein WS70_24865 [Burkholderia mayonis]KVE43332.1 hypothetical protein WS69_23360 [Burkholderia sp. BDU5]KVE45672.1 hypothetical protein WS70_03480 [Burkholderia mayonis]